MRTGWRIAVRLARRSVRRHLGRSLLIIALVSLPVMAATVADGIVRTLTDRSVDLDHSMGSADARIDLRERRPYDVETNLPPGTRVVPISAAYYTGSLRLSVGDRIVRTRLHMVALGDPLTTHLARLTEGRLPKNPAETLLTPALAEKLGLLDADGHLRPHATARVEHGPAVAVTGLAIEPYCLAKCADVVAPQDTLLKQAMLDGSPLPVGYLVDLPPGTDAEALVRTWALEKSTITTRDGFSDQTPFGGYLSDATARPVMLFAGLGLIGIVLTAGAAFAVGARGQTRELGLVAVNGGAAKHIRRIVLAQGLVLGVLGAATGLVAGAVMTVLGVPLWQKATDQLMEHPRFGWAELAAAAGVGILASLVAAVVPAFVAARMRPADALAGRFAGTAPRTGRRLLGVVLVLAGTAVVAVCGVLVRDSIAARRDFLMRVPSVPLLDRTQSIAGILGGIVVALAGLALVMPAVVAAVGRLGGLLPLSGRLAVRDAVRHRHRTVAAGTAIMVAVAGSVVAAFVFTSQAVNQPETLPPHTALAQLDAVGTAAPDGQRQLERAGANATRDVPGAAAVPVTLVTASPDHPQFAGIFMAYSSGGMDCYWSPGALGVGTPELIRLATGREPDAGVRAALAEGKAVSYNECLVGKDDTVMLEANYREPVAVPGYRAVTAPGTEGYTWPLPKVFISPETAAAHGWVTYTAEMAITYPAQSDLDGVRRAADAAGVGLYVAEPVSRYVTGLYYLLAGLAGLVALVGAGVTVALSATDGRADLATLAALGAQPRRRRGIAGAHALIVSVLGTLAGLAIGVCAGVVAVPVMGLESIAVPWQHLLVITVAVPSLAFAAAALATPSRLPMVARS